MGARKAEEFPVQFIGLSAVVVDHSLQSRVTTSVEYQREFSEAMLRGDEFPPVVVFFDGNYYRLADGFHRFGARKILARTDRRFEMIKAEIRDGGRKEALVYSAGANQKFSIPRTARDTQKAVYMLLEFPEWLRAPSSEISKHCGVSQGTVVKYRAAYCEENGIDVLSLPSVSKITRANKHRKKGELPFYHYNYKNRRADGSESTKVMFTTRFEGKTISLGSDEKEARKKHEELSGRSRQTKQRSLSDAKLISAAATKGIVLRPFVNERATTHPGLNGSVGRGYLAVVCKEDGHEAYKDAVARCVLGSRLYGQEVKLAIITYLDKDKVGLINLASLAATAGIETLEPDEFLDLLAGRDDSQG